MNSAADKAIPSSQMRAAIESMRERGVSLVDAVEALVAVGER